MVEGAVVAAVVSETGVVVASETEVVVASETEAAEAEDEDLAAVVVADAAEEATEVDVVASEVLPEVVRATAQLRLLRAGRPLSIECYMLFILVLFVWTPVRRVLRIM